MTTSPKQRILLFAEAGYPPRNPEAFTTLKLALAMIEHGWDLSIVALANYRFRPYPETEDELWQPLAGKVHSVVVPPTNRAVDLLRKAMIGASLGHAPPDVGWSLKALRLAKGLLDRKQYDIILSRAEPPAGHLPALVIARQTGLPWIANWSDPCPLTSSPPPYGGGPGAPMSWRMRRYLAAVGRGASWHTFPCERLRRYVASYFPADILERSSVVPHIAYGGMHARTASGSDRLVLAHAGWLQDRNPTTFLQGLRLFLDSPEGRDARIQAQFVGPPDAALDEGVARLGLVPYVKVLGPMPYNETLRMLAAADVLVIIEADCEEGVFLPSKFIDYVQVGLPILAVSPRVGTLPDVLGSRGGGIAVDRRSPADIQHGIARLYRAWRDGELGGEFGSDRLYNLYSSETIVAEYERLFEMLGARRAERRHPAHAGQRTGSMTVQEQERAGPPPFKMSREATADLVSVIVPTHNRAKLLPETIGSVQRQSWRPIEVIVVDDGSTDDTPQVVAGLQETFRSDGFEIRYYAQPNRGVSAARNRGLQESRGEFIQLLDDDDLLAPAKIETQVGILRANPSAWAVLCRAGVFGYDQRVLRTPARLGSAAELLADYLNGPTWTNHAPLYTRRACLAVGPFNTDIRVWEDWEYAVRCIITLGVPLVQDQVLAHVRRMQGAPHLTQRAERERGYSRDILKAVEGAWSQIPDAMRTRDVRANLAGYVANAARRRWRVDPDDSERLFRWAKGIAGDGGASLRIRLVEGSLKLVGAPVTNWTYRRLAAVKKTFARGR